MQLAALRHTEMAGELAAFRAAVSSVMELVFGHSLSNTAHVVVVGELIAEFQKVEDHRSWLEWPIAKICDLLPRPPPDWAWLADRLNGATG
jgi:hypothetical protein